MTPALVGPAWRIECRATPFSPWFTLKKAWRLDDACAEVPGLKARGHFYSVRVRAN